MTCSEIKTLKLRALNFRQALAENEAKGWATRCIREDLNRTLEQLRAAGVRA